MKILFDAVVHLLHTCHHGSLATQSVHVPGYPLASVLPFALDEQHRPVFLVSRLAEHTKNLAADSRSGFMVHAPDEQNVLTSERISLLGDTEQFEASPELIARYSRYQPDAEQYLALGDFAFFRLSPRGARYIAGFAKMGWIEQTDWHSAEILSLADENKCIDSLTEELPAGINLLGLDCYGLDFQRAGKRERWQFPAALPNAEHATDACLSFLHTDM